MASECIGGTTSQSFQTMVSAWDPSFPLISAAAAIPYEYYHDQEYFLVATKKPFAYSSEILLLGYQESWQMAGNGYESGVGSTLSDGVGAAASFALITSLTQATDPSAGSLVLNYLVTEHSPTEKRGHLRLLSLVRDSALSSLASPLKMQAEIKTLTFDPSLMATQRFGDWIWPSEAVFDKWQQIFLVIDVGTHTVSKIQIDFSTHTITSCITLRSSLPNFNPISLSIFQQTSALDYGDGWLLLLDGNKLVSYKEYRTAVQGVNLPQNVLCGGGWNRLALTQGASLPCNEVDLALSGATRILLAATDDIPSPSASSSLIYDTRETMVVYFLLASSDFSYAIAQLTIPPEMTDPLQSAHLTVLWVYPKDMSDTTIFPLHLIPIFSSGAVVAGKKGSILKSLFLVENKGIIRRMGGGAHTSVSCLCDEGMYCDTLSQQCLDAPPGTYTDGPWSSDPKLCPPGTVGGGGMQKCKECAPGYAPSNSFHMESSEAMIGSIQEQTLDQLSLLLPWYCQATCSDGLVFDEGTQTCSDGCSSSMGLYADPLSGQCFPCWLGSRSNSGTGIENCIPCLTGEYGQAPGVCAPCPAGTTTWSPGSTHCMPNPEDSSLDSAAKSCADGVSPALCAPVQTPLPVTFSNQDLFLQNTTILSLTASMDGILFMSAFTDDSASTTIALLRYDTVEASSVQTLRADLPRQIYHHLQLCETCVSSVRSSGSGLPRYLFHSARQGTCIYRTTIHHAQASSGTNASSHFTVEEEVFKGDCAVAGTVERGLFPIIQSIAVMETDQLSPLLYISVMMSSCGEIYALSLYDGSVRYLASQDVIKSPSAVLTVCIIRPMLLASSKGARGFLYATVNNKVYAAQVTGDGARPELFMKDTPIFQIGSPSSVTAAASGTTVQQEEQLLVLGTAITAIAVQHRDFNVSASQTNHHVVVITQNGNLHSIPPAAGSAYYNQMSTLLQVAAPASDDSTAVVSTLAMVGRRIWYPMIVHSTPGPTNAAGGLYQVILPDLKGCVGGYVTPSTDKSIEGMCMQAGKGLYTDFDGSLQSCPIGTYGLKAGGALRSHCAACPDGTVAPFPASAFCTECPSGYFSNAAGTQCVPTCPAGSYRSASSKRSCIPCQPGYTSAADASHSCYPCPEGTYSIDGICLACAAGYTSPKGAHNCVRICAKDMCALDGETCISLSKDYKILSQIFMGNSDQKMVALAVDKRGGVFYTNGNTIRYYLDDCPSYSTQCNKTGSDLLQPNLYTDYSFSSLAICNLPVAVSSRTSSLSTTTKCGGGKARKLYVSSLTYHSVFVLMVCQDESGAVDVQGTLQGGGLVRLAGFNGAGFGDGTFALALFNQPADMELNEGCTLLYLADFFNHRVRLLNLTSNMVSTIVGTGNACWKMGGSACATLAEGCNPYVDECASLNLPSGIGLSADEKTLYMAANNINSVVQVTNLKAASGSRLENICRFAFGNMRSGTIQQCSIDAANSKGCMLFRAFDVTAVSSYEMYVGVSQGITKIYSEDNGRTFSCQQIAGNYFDLYTTGLIDGISPDASTVSANNPNSKVNIPFKMAFARETGVLYFADLMNGAIRRIMVKAACVCPVGRTLLETAGACYNPSPTWAKKPIPVCTKQGYYALEGDAQCFRKCADALQQGISVAPCLVTPNNPQLNTVSYTQLLGDLFPPQSSLYADWYGFNPSLSTMLTYSWNSIFSFGVYYRQGRIPGRAPFGRDFIALSYSMSKKCWSQETRYWLQPTLMLPGLWYPCQQAVGGASCSCPTNVNTFEPLPITQTEKEAQATAPKRWQALRAAAALAHATYLDPEQMQNTPECTPKAATDGTNRLKNACTIQSRSVFMILGSPDTKEDHTRCPASAAEGGPCFPEWHHFQHQASSTTPSSITVTQSAVQKGAVSPSSDFYTLSSRYEDNAAANVKATCYLGWPAHFKCPDGFVWIAPSPPAAFSSPATSTQAGAEEPRALCNPIASQVTCLSCLPGTFSYLDSTQKQMTGGPYACQKCMQGTFSNSIGASECTACPVGKYASSVGATVCTSCGVGNYTAVPMAYSASQCVNCLPGTGNCTACPIGTYQNLGGQIHCLLTRPGFYTMEANSARPLPCAPGYYQPEAGRSSCLKCPINSYTLGEGATACISCTVYNCSMAVDNVCGKGCGLNQYWDTERKACVFCSPGTLNVYESCSMDPESCWQAPRKDYYLVNASTNEIGICPWGSEANSRFDACTPCGVGAYSDAYTKGCALCPIGKFSAQDNASTCTFCTAGKKGDAEGQAECTACERGTFSASMGAKECTPCLAGQFAASFRSTACRPCDFGTFNDAAGMSACNGQCDASLHYYSIPGDTSCSFCDGIINASKMCQGCGLGQYFVEPDANEEEKGGCRLCPPGLVNLYNTTAIGNQSCTLCPSPTAFASSAIACTEAAPGYMPNATYNGQMPCPPGSFRNASLLDCTHCPLGTHSEAEGSEGCADCKIGLYADTPGRSVCKLCSSGTVARTDRSSACMPCPAGSKASGGTVCIPCENNTFSNVNGSERCLLCPSTKYAIRGATVCSYCPIGKALVPITLNQKACGLCRPGQYMGLDAQATLDNRFYNCFNCPMGKYIDYASSETQCANCTPGTVARRAGSSACSFCGPGQFAASAYECQGCPAGTYSADGSKGCIDCPWGTYSSGLAASACTPCAQGSYQDTHGKSACLVCPPGTFSDAKGSAGCTSCLTLSGTFNNQPNQTLCKAKRTKCSLGQYVNHTTDSPILDNSCIACVPCQRDELTLFLTDAVITNNLVQYTTDNSSAFFNEICPGTTEAPLYQCTSSTPPVGQFIALRQHVGSSGQASVGPNSQGFAFEQCEDQGYNTTLVQWVAGLDVRECYVGCLYGLDSGGVSAYKRKYGGGGQENVADNIFLKRMLSDLQTLRICLPCPLIKDCPIGRFRPRGENDPNCGPPCAILQNPPLCTADETQTGCIAPCTHLPVNAGFIGGSNALGEDNCPWMCMNGFHLSDNRKACVPCPVVDGQVSEENATRLINALCNASDFVLLPPEECHQEYTSIDLCKPCPHVAYGRSIGWDHAMGRCKYQCYAGYFLMEAGGDPYYPNLATNSRRSNDTLQCRPCSAVWDEAWITCPVGMFLDQESCDLRGEKPQCKACVSKPNLINFTSNGERNASQCRGICPVGFHTISASTGQYFSASKLDLLPYVPDAYCVQCTPFDGRSCMRPSGSNCFGGYYKNISVADDQEGSCVPCRQSAQCQGAGYYAPPCTGNEVVDAPCLPCAEDLLKNDDEVVTKQFVPYSDVASTLRDGLLSYQYVISPLLCPRVCVNNFVRDTSSSSTRENCLSCKYLAFNAQRAMDTSKITSDNQCLLQGTQPSACSFIFSRWNATVGPVWWDTKMTPWFSPTKTKSSGMMATVERGGICWPCPAGMITGEKDIDLCTLLPGFVSAETTLPQAKEPVPSLPADVSLTLKALPSSKQLLLSLKKRTGANRRLLVTLNVTERSLLNAQANAQVDAQAVQTMSLDKDSNTTVLLKDGRPCPHGYYKTPKGEGVCYLCPLGSSTKSQGSINKGSCMCLFGYYLTSTSKGPLCLPCPQNTFLNTSVSVTAPASSPFIMKVPNNNSISTRQQSCTPCPPNQTTYGNVGMTRCVCALGMIMDPITGECAVCPPGYYCMPCPPSQSNDTGATRCPSDGIIQLECFPGSSSPPGSYDVDQCACAEGMVKRSRPRNPTQVFCLRIPMGGEMDKVSGRIVCKRGWSAVSWADDGSVSECTLCALGQYAAVLPADKGDVLALMADGMPLCVPCPQGFYLSSRYGMGIESCMQCPGMQSTRGEGAISLENCSCPFTMAKDPMTGACKGCSPTQYVDPKNTSLCKNCPANSMAQTGAASVAQCLCQRGFYSSMISGNSLKCVPCPKGTYSSQTSANDKCTPCPEGSTTFKMGATSINACKEDAALCSTGYAWRSGVGCYRI